MPSFVRVAALIVALAVAPIAKANPATTKLARGICYYGCQLGFQNTEFSDYPPNATYFEERAASVYWLTSLVHCLDVYCKKTFDDDYRRFNYNFVTYGPGPVNSSDYYRALTNYSAIQTVDVEDQEALKLIYSTTLAITPHNIEIAIRTQVAFPQIYIYDHAFGWSMYLLVGLMLIGGTINRLFALYVARRHLKDPEDAYMAIAPGDASLSDKVQMWWRRNVSVPAAFGYRHIQPLEWFAIPTRLQALGIFFYVAINIIFTFVHYDVFEENMFYPRKDVQFWRYVADRSGIMSFWNLPLLWALGGRNDVLIWLTGWSFRWPLWPAYTRLSANGHSAESCNTFHRWVSIVATVQAILHSAAYSWFEVALGSTLAENFEEMYWATGVFATVTMSLIIPLAIRPIRQKLYELFLIVHIVLAVATLVLLFYHVTEMDGEYDAWLWACVGIWAFDRFLRYVRVGVLSYKTMRSGGENTVASLTGQPGEGGLIRLTVQSSITIDPKPGSYYYLYTPRSWRPWENHPFTLASWEQTPGGTTFHFHFAPLAGATRRIEKRIAQAKDLSTKMTVLLEGPYGTVHPVPSYEQILLVAGGSGITAILPYAFSIVNSSPRHARKVTIVWVVRKAAYAADLLSHELAPKNTPGIDVHVHVSREDGPLATDFIDRLPNRVAGADDTYSSDGDSTGAHKEGKDGASFKVAGGRPVMANLLAHHISQLVGSERLAVLACGPATMLDDLRRAVANSYGNGEGQVRGDALEYFEDAFSW
ncbi:hypothetical protein DXG03_000070 [Asterophora parasitica]|uniref:ferric-chelate reductase (NADPH) n=1 Tax=Asterophora parasitica TaxID=117018 RepID=A0A9P7GHK4_9AGAR|nr:hypothetical protein DXG03_000070 [Asterophora parasitica]